MKLYPVHESSGWRHYLNGRPVHCGTQLQLLVREKPEVWVWAQYEASIRADGIGAFLYTDFGRVWPDSTTVLRWPADHLSTDHS